jgi:glyoxylate carboligase
VYSSILEPKFASMANNMNTINHSHSRPNTDKLKNNKSSEFEFVGGNRNAKLKSGYQKYYKSKKQIHINMNSHSKGRLLDLQL